MQMELGANGNADGATLRLYPDPNADRLKDAIARHFADHGITPGTSSSATVPTKCWHTPSRGS